MSAKQVKYYGLVAIDPTLLENKTKPKSPEEKFITVLNKKSELDGKYKRIVESGQKLKHRFEKETDPIKKTELELQLVEKRKEKDIIKDEYFKTIALYDKLLAKRNK